MITDVAQRWRDRRGTYRPAGEPIDTSKYEVAEVPLRPARVFVEKHHYSGSWVADRVRYGLFRGGALVGVTVFSVPCNYAVFNCLPCPTDDAVELGRLVLLDDVPANGESWFVARCFEDMRRKGFAGVISFSDPVPQTTTTGQVVFQGHIGCVYQSLNAAYQGRGTKRTLRVLPDGKVFSDRAISKIRSRDVGWQYAMRQLMDYGAPPPDGTDLTDLRAWLPTALDLVTRKLRHAGNHKYAWGLAPSVRRKVTRQGRPYPKFMEASGQR